MKQLNFLHLFFKYLLLLFCLFSWQFSFANNEEAKLNIDSLYKIIQAEPDIDKRVAIIRENQPSSAGSDVVETQAFSDWYQELYEDSGDEGYKVNALFYAGIAKIMQGLYTETIVELEDALETYYELESAPSRNIVQAPYKIKYELSAAYSISNNNDLAQETMKSAIDEAIEANDSIYQAKLGSNLGILCFLQGKGELAVEYLLKANRLLEMLPFDDISYTLVRTKTVLSDIYNQQKNTEKTSYYLDQLLAIMNNKQKKDALSSATKCDIYRAYGLLHIGASEYEKALPHLELALENSRSVPNKAYLAYGLYDLALLQVYRKDYAKAEALIIELEAYDYIKNDNPELNMLIWEARGVYEKDIGNYDKARNSLLKLKDYYEKNIEIDRLATAYKRLSKVERLSNNHALAFEYLEKYHEIQDSIANEKVLIGQEELQVKFETQKKENQIISLKNQELESQASITRQRNIIGGGILGLLSLGILGFISFRNSRKTKKINDLLEIKNNQNEVLLKEIHHRVKNNLQTISSLLSLQSNSIEDQSALDAVQESQNRVTSMALIHQKLYQGENLAAVEMRDYFETIGKAILHSFGKKAKGVELEVDMSDIELDVDTAIPIGLITNELITNSLKYAFKEEIGGKISISMQKNENNDIELKIADDGINESKGVSEGGTGFGSMLINLLTTQIGGQLEQTTSDGTITSIKFSLPNQAA